MRRSSKTMMNSFRRNDTKRRLWASTALVVFLFLVDVISGGKIRAEVRTVGAVIAGWGNASARSISGSGFFSSRATLAAQNQSLSEELMQYGERAAAYAVFQEENAQLRDIVHLARGTPGITAPVVSSMRSSPYGTFLIGAGEADGVARGNIVLTSGGFVVGKITDTSSHTALVSEVLAPNASIDTIVSGSAIVVEGKGGGNGHGSVPRGVAIAVGQAVTVPSYGGRALGIVGEVASSTSGGAQDVYIRIPINLAALQFVYVVAR